MADKVELVKNVQQAQTQAKESNVCSEKKVKKESVFTTAEKNIDLKKYGLITAGVTAIGTMPGVATITLVDSSACAESVLESSYLKRRKPSDMLRGISTSSNGRNYVSREALSKWYSMRTPKKMLGRTVLGSRTSNILSGLKLASKGAGVGLLIGLLAAGGMYLYDKYAKNWY